MTRGAGMCLAVVLWSGAALAQTISIHEAPCLRDARGNLFFRLNGDGTKLLVNRSPTHEAEEIVLYPRTGISGVVWYRRVGRGIYDRIALSADASVVVFAVYPGSQVFSLRQPNGMPLSMANVSPDGDIRQLTLSDDGRWAAFTASSFLRDGKLGRVRVNLYVAATDGSIIHRITPEAINGKFIEFALSGNGQRIVWTDDLRHGAGIADLDGKNAVQLPAPPEGSRIQALHCNDSGSEVYYQTIGADGVKLLRVIPGRATFAQLYCATSGFYHVAGNGEKIFLRKSLQETPCIAAWWELSGTTLVKRLTLTTPRHVGSWAWSRDGKTMAWRDTADGGGFTTYVWQAAE
jgi:hypothetical protein